MLMGAKTAAVTLGIAGVLGCVSVLADNGWAAGIPDPALLPVKCSVLDVGPFLTKEAATASAKESCNDKIAELAEPAAKDVALAANQEAARQGLNTRYKGTYTCDVPLLARWRKDPVFTVFFYGSASGSGRCILNAVPMGRNH